MVNYDRGEVVDAEALDAALASGRVRYAAIDADLFVDDDGNCSGPMVPFLALAEKYPEQLELLPHAAADTEHRSRVAGACQAVDQILDCIRYRRVTNLKGDLPEGYTSAGAMSVPGVGKVTGRLLGEATNDSDKVGELRLLAEELAASWGALAAEAVPARREALLARHGAELIKASNAYVALVEDLGLKGPYYE